MVQKSSCRAERRTTPIVSAAQQQLIALTDAKRFESAGLPFNTVDQARWAYRQRHENGLAGAFVRIGSRVAINVGKFHELAAKAIA